MPQINDFWLLVLLYKHHKPLNKKCNIQKSHKISRIYVQNRQYWHHIDRFLFYLEILTLLCWAGNVTSWCCLCVVWWKYMPARAAVACIIWGPRQDVFFVFTGDHFVKSSCHTSLHLSQRIVETLMLSPCHGGCHTDSNCAVRDYHHVSVVGLIHVEVRDELAHAYATRQHLTLGVFTIGQWRFRLVYRIEQGELLLHWRCTYTKKLCLQRPLREPIFHTNRHETDSPWNRTGSL